MTGDGLLLLLFVKGGSHGWRFDYRIEGKRKMLSLGTYPDTSLAAARRKAEAARELVAEGFDPSKKRQAEKAAYVQARAVEVRREQGLPPLDSFEATAREWFAAVDRARCAHEARAAREAARRTALGAASQASGDRAARAGAAERRWALRLPRGATPRPADEREHDQRGPCALWASRPTK